jgi:hypothetical protein
MCKHVAIQTYPGHVKDFAWPVLPGLVSGEACGQLPTPLVLLPEKSQDFCQIYRQGCFYL